MTGIALVQGCYFFLTGIWPLVHIESFQKVTGRKTDLWLVRTVGVLVLALGLGLIIAGVRQHFAPELILIAMASALGLTAIDLFYAFQRVISLVYLLDALVEAAFLVWWTMALLAA